MHTSKTKDLWNISDDVPRFGSTKRAAGALRIRAFYECVGVCAIRAALALAVLSALLLIAARSAQAQTVKVLHSFAGGSDGDNPQSRLTFDAAGNLYGTTYGGGTLGYGTVFELSPNGGGGWNETVLYSFTGGADGGNPTSAYVMFDSVGNLYGTAYNGGANGYGVVFELSPEGASWTETVLHTFAGGTDGANPVNGLIMDGAGNLYGKTYSGGYDGFGTVFELSPSGGGWTNQVIVPELFGSSDAGLTMDAGEIVSASLREVFYICSCDGWITHWILVTYSAEGTPVFQPGPRLGDVFGTTLLGGSDKEYGTVYMLRQIKRVLGSERYWEWTSTILHSFGGSPEDGDHPWGGVVVEPQTEIIFGTTAGGGENGDGTVFALWPTGRYHWYYQVVSSFNGTDGAQPVSDLILDSAGNVYGTASGGGSSGAGVVFEVNGEVQASTTALTSSPNPSNYGQTVTLTAVVSPAPPDGETVTFIDDRTGLGTGTLSGGSASLTTSTLKLGTTLATAVYGGDWNYTSSTSNALRQAVGKATTATALASSQNPSNAGQSVTFTASVTPQFSGKVTGTVIFYDGTTELESKPVKGGAAQFTTSKLTSGVHTITSTYTGSPGFTGSSASLTQTVN